MHICGWEAVTQTKWEGKACVELATPTAQEVWHLVEDFCNLHKWLTNVDTCYQVDGIPGQPGLVRYCASTITSSSNGNEETMTRWAKEKLLMIDPIKRCLSYEVIDNNIGMKFYVAKLIVSPNDDSKMGEWSFVCDPIEGLRHEDFLLNTIETGLQSMAKKMEVALLSTR
ncbi:lachrymatory-factor synthase-like [Quercus suber]|uniref:Lachrymatory-factor synthase n=1 Tax=Quercus suber TaxID=58331 RepID=A0AAW0L0F2_QUESU